MEDYSTPSQRSKVTLSNWVRLNNAPLLLLRASAVQLNDFVFVLASDGTTLLYHNKHNMWSMLPKSPYTSTNLTPALTIHNGRILTMSSNGDVSTFDSQSCQWTVDKDLNMSEGSGPRILVSNNNNLYSVVDFKSQVEQVQQWQQVGGYEDCTVFSYNSNSKWEKIYEIGSSPLKSAAVAGGTLFVYAGEEMFKLTLPVKPKVAANTKLEGNTKQLPTTTTGLSCLGTRTPTAGLSLGQASTAGLNFGQAPTAGLSLGQAPTAGLNLGQAPTAGLNFGQAPTAGLSLGQAPTAGLNFGQAPTAGLSLGQAPTAGLNFGQAPTAGLNFGQAPTAGLSLGQAPTAGLNFGQAPTTGLNFGQAPTTGLNFGQAPTTGLSLGTQASTAGLKFGTSYASLIDGLNIGTQEPVYRIENTTIPSQNTPRNQPAPQPLLQSARACASPTYAGSTLHAIKDTLFSFGGRDKDNQPTSDVLRYNPDTNTWERVPAT